MMKNEKELQVLRESDEIAVNQIVRCQVMDSGICKVLYPLALVSLSERAPLTPVPSCTLLPLIEVDNL
jgi:hypothetical protein